MTKNAQTVFREKLFYILTNNYILHLTQHFTIIQPKLCVLFATKYHKILDGVTKFQIRAVIKNYVSARKIYEDMHDSSAGSILRR